MKVVSKSSEAKSAIEDATRIYCPKREPVRSRSFSTGTTTPNDVVLRIKPRRIGLLAAPGGAKSAEAANAIANVAEKIKIPSGSA